MAESIKKKINCEITFIKSSGGRFELYDGEKCLFSKMKKGRFPLEQEILDLLKP
ncbi:MAG: Rdx family protein [Calditrichaceae bacterium]|nr:Rdx family protein [Calditrichaceae bacterium]RQV96713.1 MAG: hypothetical protein EH224_03950 [Calditrichota bacterium]